MRNLMKRLWKDESAISAVEYGIIAAVFAAGLIAILVTFKGKVATLFSDAGDTIAGAGSQ